MGSQKEALPDNTFSRFMKRVAVLDNGCWQWTGAPNSHGYGRMRIRNKSLTAHRISYLLFVGALKDGLVIDHICRKRDCVNPAHLELVTVRENTMRGVSFSSANAVKTHCVNGHEFSDKNTRYGSNRRSCRVCNTVAVIKCRRNKRMNINSIGADDR